MSKELYLPHSINNRFWVFWLPALIFVFWVKNYFTFKNKLLKMIFNNLQVSLEKLYLHLNSIFHIEDKAFSNLVKLRRLDLHYNSLGSLRPEIFSGLESLKYMHLAGNRLTMLVADVFKHLPRPLELWLSTPRAPPTRQNVLNCDTRLCWVKVEELRKTITWTSDEFKPRCADGIEWDSLNCSETGHMSHYIHFILIFKKNILCFKPRMSPIIFLKADPQPLDASIKHAILPSLHDPK